MYLIFHGHRSSVYVNNEVHVGIDGFSTRSRRTDMLQITMSIENRVRREINDSHFHYMRHHQLRFCCLVDVLLGTLGNPKLSIFSFCLNYEGSRSSSRYLCTHYAYQSRLMTRNLPPDIGRLRGTLVSLCKQISEHNFPMYN